MSPSPRFLDRLAPGRARAGIRQHAACSPAAPAPGFRQASSAFAPLVVGAAALLAACSGGDRAAADARIAAREAAGCATVDTAAIARKAVTAFLDSVQPKPLRFLYMAGTDSTLPESGQRALQDKGPTYLWPADAKQQPAVKQNLENRGPWNALLVTWKGLVQPTPETARVRIGATWVGPVDDGKQLGVKLVTFECRSTGDSAHKWVQVGMTQEQGA